MHVFNQSRVAQTQGSLFRLAQLGQVDWNRLNLGPVVPKSRLKLVGWVPLVVWPLMLGLNQRPGHAEVAPALSGAVRRLSNESVDLRATPASLELPGPLTFDPGLDYSPKPPARNRLLPLLFMLPKIQLCLGSHPKLFSRTWRIRAT